METSFSDGEYDRRLAAVREEAEKERLGALLFFNPSSICYLCGFTTINLWDVSCLIVPPAGDPVLVFREFESGRFTASCRFTGHVSYPPDGRAAPAIVRALRELCALNEMAVEMGRHLDTATLEELRQGLGDVRPRDCSAVLNPVRLVKSAEEVAVMKRAAAITDAGVGAGIGAVREGTTDYEICAEVARALFGGGSDFMCIQPVVAVGEPSGIAHSTAGGVRVRRGDPVFLEIGACVERYTAPIMRTAFAGVPDDELRELSDYSSRALDSMIAVMGPGVPAAEVAGAGYGALKPVLPRIAFHFVWGYSVGIGYPPSWLEETGFLIQSGNPRKLMPGMVFHLPLMLRIPGKHGAGHSESVLVTRNGAEILSRVPREGS